MVRRRRRPARAIHPRARGLGPERADQRRRVLGRDGYRSGDRRADPTNTWIDRLAPRAAAVLALGTCAAFGGIPAMRNNPTGAMGLRDYLGWNWTSRRGRSDHQPARLPGAAGQHHRDVAVAGAVCAGAGPMPDIDAHGRPRQFFSRTVHEGCDRAGLPSRASSRGHPRIMRLPGEARVQGSRGHVQRPIRGWVSGIGGCPNVGGICIACTMPGFPDKFMPFMDANPLGTLHARAVRFTYGPFVRRAASVRDPAALRSRAELARARRRAEDRIPAPLVRF